MGHIINTLTTILSLFVCGIAYGQTQSREARITSTCDCLRATLTITDKFEYVHRKDGCIRALYNGLLKEMSPREADEETTKIMGDGLKEKCDVYEKSLKFEAEMNKQRTASRIDDPVTCRMFRTGEFIDATIPHVVISMRDSIQVVTFNDIHAYTRSRVTWIDECTYKLVILETTHALEKEALNNNIERIVRILEITSGGGILLEVEVVRDKWYTLARLKKK